VTDATLPTLPIQDIRAVVIREISVLNNSLLSAEVKVRKHTSSSCYGSELSDTNAGIFDNLYIF